MLLRKQRCGYVQYYFYAYRKIAGSASRTFKIHNLKDSLGMCDFFWNMAETTDDGDLSKICRYYSDDVLLEFAEVGKLGFICSF